MVVRQARVFAEALAVIADDDDEGLVPQLAPDELVDEGADLLVDEARAWRGTSRAGRAAGSG